MSENENYTNKIMKLNKFYMTHWNFIRKNVMNPLI